MTVYTDYGIFRKLDMDMFRKMLLREMIHPLLPFLQYFDTDDGRNALLATIASAMMNTTFMTPFDVVATRMYNQGVCSKGKGLTYTSVPNCFLQIFQTEGLWGFYKGWGPQFLRLGPQTVLSLFFWDRLRYLYKRSFQ